MTWLRPHRSPCLSCEHGAQDKNFEPCPSCLARVAYALTLGEQVDHVFMNEPKFCADNKTVDYEAGRVCRCKFPGCTVVGYGGSCRTHGMLVGNRRIKHPDRPEYWHMRTLEPGERMAEVYRREYQGAKGGRI